MTQIPCPSCGKNLLMDTSTGAYRCSCNKEELTVVESMALCCPVCKQSGPIFMPTITRELDLYSVICYSLNCQGATMITFNGGQVDEVHTAISQTHPLSTTPAE